MHTSSIYKLSITLIIVLLIIKYLEASHKSDYFKREHSVVKPYQVSGISIPYWDFKGDVMITNNYIRLTPEMPSKKGALWNKEPCTVKNWELQVHFNIHGKSKDLYGDGIGIWYIKDPMISGPVFGSSDYFHGLGVFLDTYANHNGDHNHEHPYISAMINNGTLHYDHDRDGTHTELAGCKAKFRNSEDGAYIAIRYEKDILTVSVDAKAANTWQECFSVKNVKLPTGYFFGFSAATGELYDNHDIISARLFELEVEDERTEDRSKISPAAAFFAPPRDHVKDVPHAMSGTKLFFLILCGLLGVCVCVIGGVIALQKGQENRRKRLY